MSEKCKLFYKFFYALLILLLLLFMLLLSGCTRVIANCGDELVTNSWSYTFDNSTNIRLSFENDNASFTVTTADDASTVTLQGLCVLSPTNFVICDNDTYENFCFSYVVHGDSLDITYNGTTLVLDKE